MHIDHDLLQSLGYYKHQNGRPVESYADFKDYLRGFGPEPRRPGSSPRWYEARTLWPGIILALVFVILALLSGGVH